LGIGSRHFLRVGFASKLYGEIFDTPEILEEIGFSLL